ncbi:FMN-linked oxidoreductase [Mollisia scopiformis]|uniref:FMN-linked oxidoreductase n=1 Tax=Mollisia scopiformis TaxID=149040 RepID=A0A194X651_MOLSC|nr:FMN-linked oxidoreductase [Mollisia scopiformis]KUJ15539.1 FMN-linked oxidoreductase [Mollisia scopiformis]
MDTSRLFQPMKLGKVEVAHRIGLAPMSRFRADDDHIPTPLMKEYFSQRTAVPGTLLFTDVNLVSPAAGAVPNAPGIWNKEQIAAWKEIIDEVHRKGCFIFGQIGAFGRLGNPESLEKAGHKLTAPSPIAREGALVPQSMTIEEIKQMVQDFVKAAQNAIEAGFDGVEFDGDNGLLIDQFTQDISNQRNDEYGGSIENRSRFTYEIAKAVADAIGPERVGHRISPWSRFNSMRMKDPIPQFTDVINKLSSIGIAYIHLIEPRIWGDVLVDTSIESLDFAFEAWKGPILIAGGYTPELARKVVEDHGDRDVLVTFGRPFIANPDLIYRVKKGLEFNHYDRPTFYTAQEPRGYIDYPFSSEYSASIESS